MKTFKTISAYITKKNILIVTSSLIVGALMLTAVRFFFDQPLPTHYHANFAVFIDGKREEFKGPGYYEEVQSCVTLENPRNRTHMHMPDNNVVHVHDKFVTWGNFFENIGWALGPDTLVTTNAVYRTQDGKTLTFLLNGKEVTSPYNKMVKDEDTLLISYGDGSADHKQQAEAAKHPTTAHTANVQHDPAACKGAEPLGFKTRLKKALW